MPRSAEGPAGFVAVGASFAPGYRGGMRIGPGIGERALEGAEDEVVDLAAVTKAHFELLRVRIDVDQLRIEREIEDVRRVPAVIEHVTVGESDGVHQQPIAD